MHKNMTNSNHPLYSIYLFCIGYLSRFFLLGLLLVNFLLYFLFFAFSFHTRIYIWSVIRTRRTCIHIRNSHSHSRCIRAVFTFTSSVSRWHQFVISIKNLNCKKAQEHSIPLALPFNVVAARTMPLFPPPPPPPFTWLTRIALWPSAVALTATAPSLLVYVSAQAWLVCGHNLIWRMLQMAARGI